MTVDKEAIKVRLEAATPGPWEWWGDELRAKLDLDSPIVGEPMVGGCGEPEWDVSAADADLIAHAPADIAALLAELELAETCAKQLRDHVRGGSSALDCDACSRAVEIWEVGNDRS